MTKNKKKLRRVEKRYSVTKSAQTLVLAGILLAGGVTGAGAAASTYDGSSDFTLNTEYNATTSPASADTVIVSDTGIKISGPGTVTISGANGLQIGKDTPDAAAKLTVGTAASEKLIIKNALTLSGVTTHTATLDLSANSALVDLITANDSAPFTITSKGTGAVNNVISVTHGTLAAYKADGTTVTGLTLDGPMTVTVNAASGNLFATDMVLSDGAIVSNTKLTGIDGAAGGTAVTHKSLSITDAGSKYTTTALALTNAGTVTLSDAGELAAATTITKGTLNLTDGGVHTGAVTLDGALATDANIVVSGGTQAAPNTITGNLSTSSGTGGTVNVGVVDAPAALTVTGTANQIGNATTATVLNVNNGSLVLFSNAGGLIIGDKGTVTADSLKLSNTSALTDTGLVSQLVNISSGGVLDIKGNLVLAQGQLAASALTTGINLASGGVLHVKNELNITNTTSDVTAAVGGTVMTDTLKAGDGTKKLTWNGGTLTLLGDSESQNFLKASGGLEIATSGIVNLGMDGVDAPMTNGGTYTGAMTFTNGTLNVAAGDWTLTNNSTSLDLGASGKLTVANDATLDLNLGAGKDLTIQQAAGLALSGTGSLTLTGNLINAAAGTITLTDNANLSVSGNLTAAVADGVVVSGGTLTVDGKATVTGAGTNGGLYVNGGTVEITGQTDIGTAGVVKVAQGSLTTDSIKTVNDSGVSIVGGGANAATLAVTGTTAKTSVITTNNSIKLAALGTVIMDAAAVANGTAVVTGVGKIDANNTTGVLKLNNYGASITKTNYDILKGNLLSKGGTLRLEGTTISGIVDGTDVSTIAGIAAPYVNAAFTAGSSLTAAGTEAKSLTANNSGATSLTVTGAGASLALAGDGSDQDFALVKNTNAGAGTTTLNATAGATLQFGLLGEESSSKGTYTGNIVLDKGTFQAVNGNFVVTGTITDANNASAVIVADKTSLTTGAITLGQTNSEISVGTLGTLEATATSSVKDVTLDGGTFKVSGATNDLTVGGDIDISNGGTLSAGKDLNLSSAASTSLDGANLKAGNAINAGNVALSAGENGLGIQAKSFTSTAALTSTGENGPLLVGITDTLTAASITADSTNAKVSQISVGNMTVSGAVKLDNSAVLVSTDKTKANTIGTTLTLGTTPDTDTDIAGSTAHMQVAGSLKIAGNTDLNNGSSLSVGEFKSTNNTTVTVGNTADTKGSSLVIDKLTADASGATTFFVDPGNGATSFMQIKSMTDGKFNDINIGGNNSIISFGEHNEAWAKTQIAESDFAPKATLVLSTPIEMGATGQILMGEKYDATGKWDVATNPGATVDTYGLALRGETLVVADLSKADGVTPGIKLNAAHNKVLIEKSVGVRLYADKLKAGQKSLLVSGIGQLDQVSTGTGLNSGVLDVKTANTTNLLIGIGDITYTKGTTNDGTLTAGTYAKSASVMLPGISGSMGSYLEHMAVNYGFDPASDNRGVQFVSRALDNRFIGSNNPTLAATTIEGAAQLAVVGAAPAMTLAAVQAGTSAVTTRTSFASPLMDSTKAVALHKGTDGTVSVDSGLNAGNGMKNGFGLWIMPLYQSNTAWGMKGENFKGGYSSDLGGVALGADYTVNDMFRFGLAFNIGGGYAQSSGDFNKTDNSFSFWGINAYGGWTMNNFGITADVGYTGNYNKLEQELPGSMGMGDIKSDVTSSAWTAGLRGEYKFETEVMDIIPHVGVRYTGLTTDEYKAKSGGGTVFKVDQDFQSIWTFPVGVTFAKEIENSSGWIFRPQLDLGITPAAGDVKAKSKARIPGVDGSAEMKMQVVDYMSYDGGVGLEMKKDNISFGINYNIQASEHRTGHGVFGTFRYEF